MILLDTDEHLAFVGYYKAFDSIETWAFQSAIDDARTSTKTPYPLLK